MTITTDSTELFKKYNVPGPRYTSYPTVPYWDTDPTTEQWLETIAGALEQNERTATGAAIYVHVPFCRSLCTYCGCNTRITRNNGVVGPYIRSILNEWKMYFERLGRTGSILLSEIHLGGGTPTFMTPAELETLLTGILERTKSTPDAEYSVEADPRVTTREHLRTLARLGFRRLSLGIQDFDPYVQDIVNRTQTEEQVREVTENARSLGFTSVNYDLIYGLPFQTLKSVQGTIEAVMRLKPDRIAFYGYAHVPWIKPGQRRFTEADLPTADYKRSLYELGRSMLEDAGYREIGMDHFALESDSLWQSTLGGTLHRNFMGYTNRLVAPLFGLGVSAIGDSWGAFVQNEKSLEAYQRRIEAGELPLLRGHLLNEEDRILRRHVLDVMTRFQTSWKEPERYTPFLDTVGERLVELQRDGLVELGDRTCSVTSKGRPFLRNACMAFDARLVRRAPSTQLFSKTI